MYIPDVCPDFFMGKIVYSMQKKSDDFLLHIF